jgi:hypothetical protein
VENTKTNQRLSGSKFFVYGIIGFIIGAIIDDFKGGLFFAALSLVFYYIKIISSRTSSLEHELKEAFWQTVSPINPTVKCLGVHVEPL